MQITETQSIRMKHIEVAEAEIDTCLEDMAIIRAEVDEAINQSRYSEAVDLMGGLGIVEDRIKREFLRIMNQRCALGFYG